MTDLTASISRPARSGDLIATLRHWLRVARTRRALASLDAAQLDDLGLSARDARNEAQRPFWDAPARWRC